MPEFLRLFVHAAYWCWMIASPVVVAIIAYRAMDRWLTAWFNRPKVRR